jgi:AmiR/NasT family two-component response regulator
VGEGDELMERLTQRLRTGEVLMASDYEEKYTEQEWISVLQDRLAAYEDTGLTPGDIKELLDMAMSKTDKVLRLKEELHTIKNELCQYCGKYKQAHEGACDGCKWREM